MIATLKGLTFKIELKITDIQVDNLDAHERPQAEKSSSCSSEPSPSGGAQDQSQAKSVLTTVIQPASTRDTQDRAQMGDTTTVTSRPAPQPTQPLAPKSTQQPVPKPARTLQETSLPRDTSSSFPQPSMAKPQQERTQPKELLPSTSQPAPPESEQANPMFMSNRPRLGLPRSAEPQALVPPKTVLIRGELEVNSVVNTCCVSLDRDEKPPMAYILYNSDKTFQITTKISQLTDEIENLPPVATLRVGDMVIAKSNDDNIWYRSVVESVDRNMVKIFFFDWGVREQLDKERVKILTFPELSLKEYPACAVRLLIVDTSTEMAEEFYIGESSFKLKIKSYDDFADYYEAAIIAKSTQI